MVEDHNFLIKKKSWYKHWWGIMVIFFAMLAVAFVVWFLYLYSQVLLAFYQGADVTEQEIQDAPYEISDIVDANDPSLGNADAVIKIVEFGDFNCPICLKNYTSLRELSVKYPETVQVYWKNYPITSMFSIDLAIGGYCAGLQDKFWPYHDRVFQMQGNIEDTDELTQIAVSLGMDGEVFAQCMQNDQSRDYITQDFQAGEDLELLGTPTFIINGYKIQGYLPMSVIEDLVEQIKAAQAQQESQEQ